MRQDKMIEAVKSAMAKWSFKFDIFAFFFIFYLIVGASKTSADFSAGPYVVGRVISVSNYGEVVFESGDRYRLWGIIPDVDFLRSNVVGQTIYCTLAGQINSSHRRTEVANCSFEIEGQRLRESIAGYLIQMGHGAEICSETLNWFKTCGAP